MKNDNFTYSFYKKMISEIVSNGYRVCSYFDNYDGKVCILRHDVDFDIQKALCMARIENELGVSSTYFVLLRTDFYNPLSKKSISDLQEIISLGHHIGLHFDEKSYSEDENIIENIKKEAKTLGEALGCDIRVVSMHRPSKKTLDSNYSISKMVNSYSNYFFKEYKYLSDSRRRWKEDVIEVVKSNMFSKLHILTHSFWYNDNNQNIKDSLIAFIEDGKKTRFEGLKDNISDFDDIF